MGTIAPCTPSHASRSAATKIAVTPIPSWIPAEAHTGHYATSLERIPRVDETECVGCNLCSLVCPVEDASQWSKSRPA